MTANDLVAGYRAFVDAEELAGTPAEAVEPSLSIASPVPSLTMTITNSIM